MLMAQRGVGGNLPIWQLCVHLFDPRQEQDSLFNTLQMLGPLRALAVPCGGFIIPTGADDVTRNRTRLGIS